MKTSSMSGSAYICEQWKYTNGSLLTEDNLQDMFKTSVTIMTPKRSNELFIEKRGGV